MRKLFLIILTANILFPIEGTITFYDGTTLDGELSSSDVSHVSIIPDGLVLPEKIPVMDIDNFKLDNGIVIIENGIAKQTYLDGKFSVIEIEEKTEDSLLDNEEDDSYSLGNLDYFSISTFYGLPIYFRPSLLLDNEKTPTVIPNLGMDITLPYFPVGPFNMSASFRIITFGFNKNFETPNGSKRMKSVTTAGLLKTDLQPILTFFGENFHPSIETGLTYSIGWEEDYSGGLGIVVGASLDYWFEDSPLGIRFFGNGYMVPGPENSDFNYTGFGNIGASVLLSLKRND